MSLKWAFSQKLKSSSASYVRVQRQREESRKTSCWNTHLHPCRLTGIPHDGFVGDIGGYYRGYRSWCTMARASTSRYHHAPSLRTRKLLPTCPKLIQRPCHGCKCLTQSGRVPIPTNVAIITIANEHLNIYFVTPIPSKSKHCKSNKYIL